MSTTNACRRILAFTQMTVEVASDEEYFSAMYEKMRIRTALVGVESFYDEGLKSAGKSWSPSGQEMVDTIRKIQDRGILVLGSMICGLESDTVESFALMRDFALQSGSVLAQFTIYRPYPGTKDYYEMLKDKNDLEKMGFQPRHNTSILYDRFWLDPSDPVDWFRHATLPGDVLLRENKECWDTFYSTGEIMKRIRSGVARTWPLPGKLAYLLLSMIFKRVYARHGVSADSVQDKKGLMTRMLIKSVVAVYNHFFRQTRAASLNRRRCLHEWLTAPVVNRALRARFL